VLKKKIIKKLIGTRLIIEIEKGLPNSQLRSGRYMLVMMKIIILMQKILRA
jgi:hypothetical protein